MYPAGCNRSVAESRATPLRGAGADLSSEKAQQPAGLKREGASGDERGVACRFCGDAGLRAALGRQQRGDLGTGPRTAKQEALPLVAALRAQIAEFGFGLDAFGRNGHAEARAKADDRTHDRLRVAIASEVTHKRLVDLDLVERKASEIAEAGITGAEIVHRDAHAERAQRVQRGQHFTALFKQQGFGDFEFEPLCRQTGFVQRVRYDRKQITDAELQRRQVYSYANLIRPARCVLAGTA